MHKHIVLLSFVLLLSNKVFGCEQEQFKVYDGQQYHPVKSYDIDPLLRKMNAHQIHKFLENGNKIRAVKLDNGDYILRANMPGKGGGPAGATFGIVLGQVIVWGACHTAAVAVGTFGTPMAGAAAETAIHAASPWIEVVAIKASLGLGIFFGVLTGPV